MGWLEYTYVFRVRFRDTDAYGIVHHSNYFCYFEEARYEFSKMILGFDRDIIDDSIVKFPVIEASCKYRNAIQYIQENLYVHLKFRILDDVKIEFLYELKDQNDKKTLATGRTVHAVVDENDRLCLSIPEWISNKVDESVKGNEQ